MNEIPKPALVDLSSDPRQPTEPLAEPLVMTKGPGEVGALVETHKQMLVEQRAALVSREFLFLMSDETVRRIYADLHPVDAPAVQNMGIENLRYWILTRVKREGEG